MDLKLAATAASTAQNDPALVGVAPTWIMTLLNLLIPGIPALFSSCLGPTPTPATVKEQIEEAYNENDGTYSRSALGPVAHQARVTARRQRNRITVSQAQAIATHALDATRTSSDDDVQEALTASSRN